MPRSTRLAAAIRSEDWMAVWLGFVIIAAVLFGFRPALPKYH